MQPPARPDPYARRLRVAYESADASPGGQLTAEGLTMKPHIYRLRGSWYCIKYNPFRVRMSWSPPAKGDTPADAYLAAELVRGW